MFVTYYCNTFNREHLLKNMLMSFEACNVSDVPFEWIITDYGSKDGTRDFLLSYSKEHRNVTVVFGNENDYSEHLKRKNISVNDKRLMYAIMGMSRNVALSLAKGDYYVEIADDHQFIRKGDWISDALNILESHDNVSTILYRGLSRQRLQKPNNKRSDLMNVNGTEFYLSFIKGYDDYHITKRSVHDKIGSYMQPDKLINNEQLKRWNEENFTHYIDYVERATELGFCKAFLKYPYVIDFPNYTHSWLNKERNNLIVPIIEDNALKENFCNSLDPISTDEIFEFVSKTHGVIGA